jgi:anti-sigma B factor antagonist
VKRRVRLSTGAMMGDDDRVRENRLRRMAARQGLRLLKSTRRDQYADGYGTYRLVGARDGEHRYGDAVTGYGMDLDAVEQQLKSRPPTTFAPATGNGRASAGAATSSGAVSELMVAVQYLDGHAEVVLSGELDCASAPRLRRALEQLIIEGHRDLRINVSALAFLDATGIGALTDIRVRLAELQGRLSLLGVRGIPRRALTACGCSRSSLPPLPRPCWCRRLRTGQPVERCLT